MRSMQEPTDQKTVELPEGQLTGEDVVTADSITEDQVVDYILAKHPNITGCFAANGDSVKLAVDGLERNKMEKKSESHRLRRQ
mgnify:FL=1